MNPRNKYCKWCKQEIVGSNDDGWKSGSPFVGWWYVCDYDPNKKPIEGDDEYTGIHKPMNNLDYIQYLAEQKSLDK